jgi:hypothetical protein
MADFAGPLHGLVLSRTLWTIVAPPMAGFVWHLVVGRRNEARAQANAEIARALAASKTVGIVSSGGAALATFGHLALMVRSSGGPHALLQPILRGARIGQLDAGIDFWFDGLSAGASALTCLVAMATLVVIARRPAEERRWQTWAWVELSLSGALVSFLADGFVALAIGWSLAAAAATWLAGWSDARAGALAATRSAAAIGAMLLAASLVFWGLGGRWEGAEYAPNSQPRYVEVTGASRPLPLPVAEALPDSEGQGSITLTGRPGARVFVDDARAVSLRSPFVAAPIAAGAHTIRIHAGPASDDATLNVSVGSGVDVELLPFGPSLSMRQIAVQLSLDADNGRPGDDDDAMETQRAGLAAGPRSTAAMAILTLLAAAAAMCTPVAPPRAPLALIALSRSSTTALLGPLLLARAVPLGDLAPAMGELTAAVGVAIMARSGRQALARRGSDRWVALLGGAPPGLAWVALGLRGVGPAAQVMLAAVFVTAASLLMFASRAPPLGDDGVSSGLPALDAAILDRLPERFGTLAVSFERWVIEAVAGALATVVGAAAWVASRCDAAVLGGPMDAVAERLVRSARAVSPALGGSLARVAWVLVASLAAAALLHALRPAH